MATTRILSFLPMLSDDNENSYTSQMVRTIKYFAELN